MKWMLVSSSAENPGLLLVQRELVNMKIECSTVSATKEAFCRDPAYYFTLLKSITHCAFFDNGMDENDPSLTFLFGFMSGHKVPIFLCSKASIFVPEKLPAQLSCYQSPQTMINDIKSRLPQFRKEELKRIAYRSLFNSCIPFTADSFADHIAHDNLKVCELFLAAGMDLNSRDKEGTPMLCIAARNDRETIANWLLDHGAEINVVSSDRGYSPTMDAVWRSNTKITKLFIEKGADLNFISRDGQPVLVLAVGNGNEEICEMLVKHGADPDVKDSMGMSAREYAKLFKINTIISSFEKYTGRK